MTANRLVLLIAAVFILLVALISQGIFERIPHVEDEAAYWFQAQVFAQGRLAVATPPYRLSFWSPFVIDYNGLRFGKYPPGFSLLLGLGMLAGAPWAVNALLGALALVLLADLGRRVYTPTVGLLAAALALTCPALLVTASSLLSHTASIFWATLFMWAFARMGGTRRADNRSAQIGSSGWNWAAVAGFALGFLFITRPYDAIAVGLPFAVYLLTQLADRRRRAWLVPALVLTAVAGLVATALPMYWYYLSGRLLYDPYLSVYPYDRPGFGPDIGNGGYTLVDAWFNLKYNLGRMATGFLGWPWYMNVVLLVVPFVAGTFVALWRKPRRPGPPAVAPGRSGAVEQTRADMGRHSVTTWDILLLATFVSVVVLYATYWYYGGHDGGFPRYWLAALPALLLLTARGLVMVATALRGLVARSSGLLRHVPVVLLYLTLSGLVAYNAFVFMPPELVVFRGRYGVTAAPLQVTQQAGIHHALVFVYVSEHWNDFAVFFAANSPTLDSDVVFARYRNPGQARSVRALYPDRACYLQRSGRLEACPVN